MKKFGFLGAIPLIFLFNACNNPSSNNATDGTSQTPASTTAPEQQQQLAHPQEAAPAAPLASADPAQTIPAFTFYKVKSGISFTNEDIGKGRNTAFVFFDPSCGYCQHEATALSDNYDKIKDINIYYVSMNDPALMVSFLDTFGKQLVDKDHVEMLYDRNQDFIKKIHIPNQFPANYVYGPDGELLEYWEGNKEVADVIKAFNQ